ncbi:MAG: HNH endonuclease [Xanthobacteraceae bacterium]
MQTVLGAEVLPLWSSGGGIAITSNREKWRCRAQRVYQTRSNEYIKRVLKSDQIGELEALDQERRQLYEEWLQDDDVLTWQALYEIKNEMRDARIAAADNPSEVLENLLHGELPPIQEYRVPFDVVPTKFDFASLSADHKKLLKKKIRERKRALAVALRTGVEDNRKPLDEARRALFVKQVQTFRAEDHPEQVPGVFRDGECNIFGHICPVFFAAEAITETRTERRRGRYIPFEVKMRVVRRDNHTCQHCGKHLADDEVEFDHKIPISKGGSSEEHNVRLTCYDCNRDKKDSVEI